MEEPKLIGNAWLTKNDDCYWLHVKTSEGTIASMDLSVDENSNRETWNKWAEEQLSKPILQWQFELNAN